MVPISREPEGRDERWHFDRVWNRRTDHGTLDTRLTESIPGMSPRYTARNLLVGFVYSLVLTVVTATLFNIAFSYRPFRGC